MRKYLENIYPALCLICLVFVMVACSAGSPDVEDIAPVESIETQTPASDEALTQGDLTAEIIEPISPLTSTMPTEDDLAVEIVEPTPTKLPTELVEPEATVVLPVSSPEEPTVPSSSSRSVPIEGSEEALNAAIADLAEKLGVSADDIALVSMEAMDWSDASLGCPQEGFMYAQVVTPGFLMTLEANGRPYEYHTDQTTHVVLCEEQN